MGKKMMNSLSLFSGYAGIDLALSDYCKPIMYCEKDEYAQGILLSRMDDGSIPFAPIWNDVTTLDGTKLRGLVDLIAGGFPCQDISVAGKGAGLAGERSGLFREICRIARESEAPFIFLENVPAIQARGAEQVQEALASMGYASRWLHLSAAEVGANHKRERWFCLATNIKRLKLRIESGWSCGKIGQDSPELGDDGEKESMAHADGKGLEGQRQESCGACEKFDYACDESWWETERGVCRVDDGTPKRVDRIKALGNGCIPLQAKGAFEILSGIK
jgi:DNA (cytosine-5)-methyltransferase 1